MVGMNAKCTLHASPRPHLCDDCARGPRPTTLTLSAEDRGRIQINRGLDSQGRQEVRLTIRSQS